MAEDTKTTKMSDVKIAPDSPLVKIYRLIYPETPVDREFCFSDFSEVDEDYDVVGRFCLKRLEQDAENLLPAYEEAALSGGKVDSDPQVLVYGLGEKAYVFVFPALNGGNPVTKLTLPAAIRYANVKVGIKREELYRICDENITMKMVCVAEGTQPVDGEDGYIIDKFPREVSFSINQDEQGNVDFKNLNWLIKIEEGDTICEIVRPTSGTDGANVRGEPIPAKPGRQAEIPMGKNTKISEDCTRLVAEVTGQLVFRNDTFCVDRNLTIPCDIGGQTGNIEAIGNVNVQGNVTAGYSVRATGNVTINGSAEAAIVVAGGNLIIKKGITGEGKGHIEAGGTIKCIYIEECTVVAGGDISADMIVNSKVRSEGTIYANHGEGVIVGGTVSSLHGIKVKEAGNDSNKKTEISVCVPEGYEQKLAELEKKLGEAKSRLTRESENRAILAKKMKLAELHKDNPAEVKRIIGSVEIDNTVTLEELEENVRLADEEYKDMSALEDTVLHSAIDMDKVYPGVVVRIGDAKHAFDKEQKRCVVKRSEGEINF